MPDMLRVTDDELPFTNPYGVELVRKWRECTDSPGICIDCGSSNVWFGVDSAGMPISGTWCDDCQQKLQDRAKLVRMIDEVRALVTGNCDDLAFDYLSSAKEMLGRILGR